MAEIRTLVYFDLEATGLKSSGTPRVCEISLLAVNTNDVLDLHVTLMDHLKNRKTDVISNLTNGPGKLTQAMQITLKQYDLDLTKNSSLFIIDGNNPTKIITKPRVGIKTGIDKLWNFSYKI